jgi:two-component system response regulator FixJ
MPSEPTVFVVDTDAATRNAVRELVSSMSLACRTYSTGREFLEDYTDSHRGCLVLELKIPDTSGLKIQQRLAANHATLPLIFLTAQTDVSLAVEVMRSGAFHYLQKPIRPVELWNTIQEAMSLDQRRRQVQQRHQHVSDSLAVLSAREQEVLRLIAQGKSNGVMAEELDLSTRTVELHRTRLMRKLRMKSPVGLLHFALVAFHNGNATSSGNGCRGSATRERSTARLLARGSREEVKAT